MLNYHLWCMQDYGKMFAKAEKNIFALSFIRIVKKKIYFSVKFFKLIFWLHYIFKCPLYPKISLLTLCLCVCVCACACVCKISACKIYVWVRKMRVCTLKIKHWKIIQLEKVLFIKVNELSYQSNSDWVIFIFFKCAPAYESELFCQVHLTNNERLLYHSNISF